MPSGRPIERPPGTLPPCRYRQHACPKGTPEDSKALSRKNLLAYLFDQECKAVVNWPDDPRVRRNAGIIRRVEESIERGERRAFQKWVEVLACRR